MTFVDANIFLRLITRDDPAKVAASEAWFRRLRDGGESGITTESILAEVVFVLSSKALYNVPRPEIIARLAPLVSMPALRIETRSAVLHALELYVSHPQLSFADSLSAAHALRLVPAEILSYDRGFDRVPGITRVEP